VALVSERPAPGTVTSHAYLIIIALFYRGVLPAAMQP
jgi:hypothetical protein